MRAAPTTWMVVAMMSELTKVVTMVLRERLRGLRLGGLV